MVAEVAEVAEADAGTRASIWHSGQSCGRGNISCNIGNISLVVVEIYGSGNNHNIMTVEALTPYLSGS